MASRTTSRMPPGADPRRRRIWSIWPACSPKSMSTCCTRIVPLASTITKPICATPLIPPIGCPCPPAPGRRHGRAPVLLLLETPLLRRPQALEIGDHGRDLLIAELVPEGRHGQFRGLVEGVALALADDLGQLRVRVTPGVAAVVVGRGRQVAAPVGLLPVRGALGIRAVAARAVLKVDLAPQGDLACVERRHRGRRGRGNGRARPRRSAAPGQDHQRSRHRRSPPGTVSLTAPHRCPVPSAPATSPRRRRSRRESLPASRRTAAGAPAGRAQAP
jgi:hypothetical protein